MDKKRVGNLFIEGLLDSDIDINKFKSLINSFSYYIGNKNKDYKYNLTYLESYCEDFIIMKEYIKKKEVVFKKIIKNNNLKNNLGNIDEINIKMDNFWCYEWNKRRNSGDIIYTGIIDENMIISNKVYCECECRCNNITYIDYIIIELEVDFEKKINNFFQNIFNYLEKENKEE